MINCIQFKIGDKVYSFRDVKLKSNSTSLKEIIYELSKSSKNRAVLAEILNSSQDSVQNINDILDYKTQDPDINTYIGDNAIGNLNVRGLASLLNRTGLEDANRLNALLLSNISKLNTYGYNFLVSDSVKEPEVFLGTSRAFVTLNPSHLNEPQTLTRIVSYLHADAAAEFPNNPLHKIVLDYTNQLLKSSQSSNRMIRDLERWDAPNKVKRMLIYSQDPKIVSQYPIMTAMLSDIGRHIAGEVVEEKTITSGGSEYSTLEQRYVNPEATYTIEDTPFTIKSLLNFRNNYINEPRDGEKVTKKEVAEALEVDEDILPDDSRTLRFLLKSSKENDIAKALYGNSDPEVLEQLKELGIAGIIPTFIAKTTPRISNDPDLINYYTPKISNIKMDDNLEIGNKDKLTIITSNSLFAKDSILLRIDPNQKTFFKKINSRGNHAPEFVINPNLPVDISDDKIKSDIEIFTSKWTKSGARKKTGVRNSLYVTADPNYQSSSQTVQAISDFLTRVNTDKSRIWMIQTTAYDNLGMDLIKAARQSAIAVQVFPNIYDWKRSGYKKFDKQRFIKDLEQLEVPITNSVDSVNYSFNDNFQASMNPELNASENISQFNLLKMGKIDTLPVRDNHDLAGKQIGDIVTLTDDKTGYSYKMQVTGSSDFKFKSKLNKWTDFFSGGQYKLGTVFNIAGKEMMLLEFTDDNKFLMTDGTNTMVVDRLSTKIGGGSNYPLYLSDAKLVGNDMVYYNNLGLIGEDGLKKQSVSDFYDYFDEEIQKFSKHSGYTVQTIKSGILRTPSDFKKYKLVSLGKYSPSKYNLTSVVPTNYSNINMLDIIARKVTNAGVAVRLLPTSEIEKIGFGLTKHKAFIYQGEIILNEDLATEDSLIHELTHLLLGDLKANNYSAYRSLLEASSKLSNFENLREAYKELSPYDYAEEVLVHNFAEYFMGRLRDWDNFGKLADKINWRNLLSSLHELSNPLNYSESDSDVMKKTLSSLLVNYNSSLLNQLNLGYNPTTAFIDRQVSNIKSQLIQNVDVDNANKLEIICK